jgi:hypothetical protein
MGITPRALRIKLLIIHRNCLIKRLKYGRWVRIQQNPATQVTRSDDLHRGPPLPAGGSNITGNLHLSYSIAVGGLCGIFFVLTLLLLIPLSSPIVFVPADNQQRVSVIYNLEEIYTSSSLDQLRLPCPPADRALLL